MDMSERDFEATIEGDLLARGPDATGAVSGGLREDAAPYGTQFVPGGYRRRTSRDYDAGDCLINRDTLEFIYVTQPEMWQKFTKQHGADAEKQFFGRLTHEIAARGTVDVLRRGIKVTGCTFALAYFRPSTTLNPDHQRHHAANCFSVARQVHYSVSQPDLSLDLVLFLNGLPLFTAELKNPLTGQRYTHAVAQYRRDRDPKEPLFALGRCLAHFAVDPDVVQVTTHLQGAATRFLPFPRPRARGSRVL